MVTSTIRMKYLIYSFVFIFIGQVKSSQVVYDQIYISMFSDKIAYCNKLLNETHIIGCDGPIKRVEGIILYKINDTILVGLNRWFKGLQKFVLIMNATDPQFYKRLERLNQAHIAGVLVVNSNGSEKFNDNRIISDDIGTTVVENGTIQWIDTSHNSSHSIGSFYRHFHFPIFYIEDATMIKQAIDCAEIHNKDLFVISQHSMRYARDYSLMPVCVAHLHAPTYAPNEPIDYRRCLAKKDRLITMQPTFYCKQFSWIRNILVPLLPMSKNATYPKRSILLLVVRLDSLTMFTGKSPGADSVYTGLITALSIVQTLANLRGHFKNSTRQVLFTFYGGEALHGFGSFYHAYSLNHREAFPFKTNYTNSPNSVEEMVAFESGFDNLTLSQIGQILELNQIYNHGQNLTAFGEKGTIKDNLVKLSSGLIRDFSKSKVNDSLHFPPSSLHSFQRFIKKDDIGMALLTNHRSNFTNYYYHSIFDTIANLLKNDVNEKNLEPLVKHLANVSSIVSQVLFDYMKEVNNSTGSEVKADVHYIRNILVCFFVNPNCTFLKHMPLNNSYSHNETQFDQTDTLSRNTHLENLIHHLLINSTAEKIPCKKAKNETIYRDLNYFYPKKDAHETVCIRHQVLFDYPYTKLDDSDPFYHSIPHWVVTQMPPSTMAPILRIYLYHSDGYNFVVVLTAFLVVLSSLVIVHSCLDDVKNIELPEEKKHPSNESLAYQFDFFNSTRDSKIEK